MSVKVVATNRKARFEYFLLDTFEAGIALQGSEAYVQTDGKEAWLINAHIAPYEQANRFNHDPRRPRKLLLHKREIRELWNAVRQKGVTIVPVQVYLKEGKAKVEIAIAKGKKLYDKRHEIAKRDQTREIERERGRDL
jgi:SsrA-binding protein